MTVVQVTQSVYFVLTAPAPRPGLHDKIWTHSRSAISTKPHHLTGQEDIALEIKHISHKMLTKMSFLALLFDAFQNLKINPLSVSVFILSSCTFSFYWFIFPRIELLRHNWLPKALLIANSNNCKSLNLFMQSVGKWIQVFIRTSFLKISDTYIWQVYESKIKYRKTIRTNEYPMYQLLIITFSICIS